jgi:hypothetical protein
MLTPVPAAAPTGDPHLGQWEAILAKLQSAAAPKYIVRGILGFGGMAGVYLADEPRLGRKVAIKVMAPGLMVDPKLVERFEQEARTIAQLSHPNIVTIYEVDERESLHWFTMTYVAGRTLGQVLNESVEPLPIPVVGSWLYQVGDALAFAHHHGIVHRDVKPGNVLIDVRGNALVTDFGIAKVADADNVLTRTGMLVGTPAYMSPEQCSSGAVSGASDQYALGTVAYQMLTGQPPFAGATLAVLQAHLAVEPMLQKHPDDRWESVSAAVQAMAAAPAGLEGELREQLKLLAAQTVSIKVPVFPESVQEGSRERLHVVLLDAAGRQLPPRRIEWTSSAPTIACVTSDHTLQALSPGVAYIGAYSGPGSCSLRVNVVFDAVRSINILPQQPIAVGESRTLAAEVRDIDDSPLPGRAVLWTSSDPAIATVTPDGVACGVAAGSVSFTARTGSSSAETAVLVTPAKRAERTVVRSAAFAQASAVRATRAKSLPGLASVPAEVKPKRRTRRLALAGAAALTVLAVLAFVMLKPSGSEPTDVAQENTKAAGAAAALSSAAPPATADKPADTGASAVPDPVDEKPEPSTPSQTQTQPRAQTQQTTAPAQPPMPDPLTGEVVLQVARLPEGTTLTVTDAAGASRVFDRPRMRLDAGRYVLEFSAPGYTTDLKTITLRAGDTELWSPVFAKVAAPAPVTELPRPQQQPVTPPVVDTRVDEAAIQARITQFAAAFANRDRSVLAVIHTEEPGLRAFVTERSVSNVRANAGSVSTPVIQGSNGVVSFTLNVSYRSENRDQSMVLPLTARLERTARGWELITVRSPAN